MQTIKQTYRIQAPARKVWDAITKPEYIDIWGGPAEMTDLPHREFSLWGGDIHGKNIEVVPEERLVQEWYGGDWPQPSLVTINLTEDKKHTHISLHHEQIPDDEAEETATGWRDYYFGPIKEYLENN